MNSRKEIMLFVSLIFAVNLTLVVAAEPAGDPVEVSIAYSSSRRYLIEGQNSSKDFLRCCGHGSEGYLQLYLDREMFGEGSVSIGPAQNSNPDFHFGGAVSGCSPELSLKLSISNVKESYAGVYSCQLFSSAGVLQSEDNTSFVHVYSQPVLTSVQQSPANGVVLSQCPFRIQCNFSFVESFCSLKVGIAKDNETHLVKPLQSIKQNATNSLLYSVGEASSASEGGQYFCVVFSRCSQTSYNYSGLVDIMASEDPIKILESKPVNITSFSSTPQRPNASGVVLLTEGSDITLLCDATGMECYQGKPNLPNLAFSWQTNSTTPKHSSNISLNLKSVTAKNSAVYTCKAWLNSQSVTQAVHRALTLLVTRSVQLAYFNISTKDSNYKSHGCYEAGKPVNVTCIADSIPDANVSISNSSGPMCSGRRQASKVFVENGAGKANFTCVATNGYTKATKTIEMCFYQPVAITVFQTDPHPSSCIPNHTSRDLQCKAAGSSLINLQILSQNNVTVSETHLSVTTYHIADSSAALSGKYSCVAEGRYNDATKYFELIVFEPLTISHFEISSKDQTVTISCSSTGLPVPTVQLLDPRDKIVASGSNGTVVKSLAVATSVSGTYTCYAKTSCGNASSSRQVFFYESSRIVYFEAVYKKEQTCACVTKKSNVNVTCKATGFPPPQVAIVGPDGLSSSDKKSVVEWNFPAKLPGNYTCKSRNENGGSEYESDRSVYICVSEPLEIYLTSCIKANSHVRGSCACTGFPLPTVQILDPYNEVLASGKGTVEFSFLSNLTSVGNYTCKADNHCYSKTQTFDVCSKNGLSLNVKLIIIILPSVVFFFIILTVLLVFREKRPACCKRQPDLPVKCSENDSQDRKKDDGDQEEQDNGDPSQGSPNDDPKDESD